LIVLLTPESFTQARSSTWLPRSKWHEKPPNCVALFLKIPTGKSAFFAKSNLLTLIAKALQEYKNRIIYGFSTGTPDDQLAAAFEQGTAKVSKRIAALHQLQDEGYRTYGMICPHFHIPTRNSTSSSAASSAKCYAPSTASTSGRRSSMYAAERLHAPTMPSKMPDSLLQLFQGKTAYSRTTLEQTGIPLNIQPHEYTLSSLSWSSLSWTSAICPPRWAYASAVQKTMAMLFRNEPAFPYRDEHGLPSDRFDTIFAR
jgi:hypothetical protein